MARKYYIKLDKKDSGILIFEESNLQTLKNRLTSYLLDNYSEISEIPELEKSTWEKFEKYYRDRILIKDYK